MLKLTWTVPYSSRRSYLSGIHREVPASHVLTLSQNKGLMANQLGLLLSLRNRSNAKIDKIVRNSVDPGAPSGGAPASNSWKGLSFGMVLTLILPFWRGGKWGPFLAIKSKVDGVVSNIEIVAEIAENVAKKVVVIADDIAKKLPDGKLKDAVLLIKKIAKEIAKDAHIVDTVIEEVEEVEESLFKPGLEDQVANEEKKIVDDEAPKEEIKIAEEAPKDEIKNVEDEAPEEEKKNVEDEAPKEEKKIVDDEASKDETKNVKHQAPKEEKISIDQPIS